jgi:hypothetical protein
MVKSRIFYNSLTIFPATAHNRLTFRASIQLEASNSRCLYGGNDREQAGNRTRTEQERNMKRTTVILIGFALAAAVFTGAIAQGADKPATPPKADPSQTSPNGCPFYGQGMGKGRQGNAWGGGGMGMGQQKRNGWGQGQGAGKGFRGGPRDGSGPRRDGSCGRCLQNDN